MALLVFNGSPTDAITAYLITAVLVASCVNWVIAKLPLQL